MRWIALLVALLSAGCHPPAPPQGRFIVPAGVPEDWLLCAEQPPIIVDGEPLLWLRETCPMTVRTFRIWLRNQRKADE